MSVAGVEKPSTAKETKMKIVLRVLIMIVALALASCAINRPTVTQLIPDPPLFMVAHPLHYAANDSKYEIVVPVGFVTDLASIPRGLWWWQAPHEGTMAPAIIHDYLYWEQSCTKDEADAVLYLALREVGMGLVNANLVYAGVRTHQAQDAWDSNRAAREKGETRFFTEDYARLIQDSQVNPKATLVSLQSEAAQNHGTYTPPLPNANVRSACQDALKEFNVSRPI
jgi:hypothetical protein